MTRAGEIDAGMAWAHAADAGAPAFAWRPSDGAFAWANAAGLAMWGAGSLAALQLRGLDQSMPATAHLRRLAIVLAPGAEDMQELTFWLPAGSRTLGCLCRKLRLGEEDVLLLQVATPGDALASPAGKINGSASPAVSRILPPLDAKDAATLAEIARMIRQRSDGAAAPVQPPGESLVVAELPQGAPEALARLSHELRTPLNAVIGYGELLQSQQQGPLGSPKYLAYTGDLLAAARHCLSLVNDLFEMTRLTAGESRAEFAEVDVNEAVRACLGILMPVALKAGVTLGDDLADGLPKAILDRRGVRQILLNLIGNAIKFTPSGGSVAIASCYRLGVGIDVVVKDTGAGMSEGKLDAARGHASDPTAPAPSGLGLPISRALAAANGGVLTVESSPGRGTEVTLFLPMSRLLLR